MRAGVGRPSGPTTVIRARPVGVAGCRAPRFTFVQAEGGPPPIGAVNSVVGPVALETNAKRDPSGLIDGENSPPAAAVSTVAFPPRADTIAISFVPISSVP